jgi:hypothetical protein
MPRYSDSDDLDGYDDTSSVDEDCESGSEDGDSYSEDEDCDSGSEDGVGRASSRNCTRVYNQTIVKTSKRFNVTMSKQPNKKTRKDLHARPIHRSRTSTPRVFPQISHQQAGVYVLKNTQTGVNYVGKSENIANRLLQHESENNVAVLIREGTITVGSVNDLESWERNEVLTRMYRHGMESVRGWKYTRKGPLTMEENISARNDIMEKFDLCRRCGHNNHFVDRCFAKSPAFWCKDIPMK